MLPRPERLRADLCGDGDAEARARRAGEATRALRELAAEATRVRDEAIVEMLRGGRRPGEVGDIAGVSKTQMVRYKERL